MKVIIVGGVAGGATAAARIRRLDEHAEITVFERSGYISYANCGLPYYIGDVITDPEELTLQTPESFFKRFRINMKIHHEVISIHPERKTVSVKNLENGEIFEENYDKLILSPGAKPTQPRLPGVGMDKLFTLRTVEDTFRIKEYINKNHPKSAVLAGGGFIGLELAENLRELGMDVTIAQLPKQLMNPFDPDMASMIHNEMRKHGIKLVLGYTVEGFKEKDNGVEVLLKDNPSLQADMVVLAIGVTPDTVLAKEAGLELGIKESIVVNDRMETSVPDIYAAGDAVQVKHYVTVLLGEAIELAVGFRLRDEGVQLVEQLRVALLHSDAPLLGVLEGDENGLGGIGVRLMVAVDGQLVVQEAVGLVLHHFGHARALVGQAHDLRIG